MTRQIKFRAWNKVTKEKIWDSVYIDQDGDFFPVESVDYSGDILQQNGYVEVEQFTGLFDKNDKEIYEGDIYKQSWGTETVIGKIAYGDMARYWIILSENIHICEIKITGEVIGNIHENPELFRESI